VVKAPGKGEQKRYRVGREMFVVAAVHAGYHDIAVDQRVVEIGTAEAGARGTDPAQFFGPGEQLGRHGPIGGISGLDVGESVLGIGMYLGDSARDGLSDLFRPRRVGIGRQQ